MLAIVFALMDSGSSTQNRSRFVRAAPLCYKRMVVSFAIATRQPRVGDLPGSVQALPGFFFHVFYRRFATCAALGRKGF